MSTTVMDFRLREEMAGAVLKEVAALEPAERLREAHWLAQIMSQAVQGLEELWESIRKPLQGGVSLTDAASLARIMSRSANFIGSALELLVMASPALEEIREANITRLQRIKAHVASLRRLVNMPAPAPDPERLRRSLEQMDRSEGVEAEVFAAELNG